MKPDERSNTTSDERLATEEPAQAADQTRAHQQEDIHAREAETGASAPGAAPAVAQDIAARIVRRELTRERHQPVESQTTRRSNAALFEEPDAERLRTRWTDIQGGFVDDPRRAVQQADVLVAEVIKRLVDGFASERAGLEPKWDRGDSVTTEELRVALQRYRAFFDRLLTV
jgi:hypothetical protein